MSKYWIQRVTGTKMPYGTPERCDFMPTVVAQSCEWIRAFTEEELSELVVLEAKIMGLIEEERKLLDQWEELRGKRFTGGGKEK